MKTKQILIDIQKELKSNDMMIDRWLDMTRDD